MIYYYTGVPGSGKSLHTAEVIYKALQRGHDVITNIVINYDQVKPLRKRPLGNYVYVSNTELLNNSMYAKGSQKATPLHYSYIDGLYGYAMNYHAKNDRGEFKEHQTYFIVDEAQEIWNSRSWNRKDRLSWCAFFREHRKYGYDCILISQDDGCIDKQIRSVLQTQILHRKASSYKPIFKLLKWITHKELFVAVTSVYGMKKKDARVESRFFFGKQKYYNFFNSMQIFHAQQYAGESRTQ